MLKSPPLKALEVVIKSFFGPAGRGSHVSDKMAADTLVISVTACVFRLLSASLLRSSCSCCNHWLNVTRLTNIFSYFHSFYTLNRVIGFSNSLYCNCTIFSYSCSLLNPFSSVTLLAKYNTTITNYSLERLWLLDLFV